MVYITSEKDTFRKTPDTFVALVVSEFKIVYRETYIAIAEVFPELLKPKSLI